MNADQRSLDAETYKTKVEAIDIFYESERARGSSVMTAIFITPADPFMNQNTYVISSFPWKLGTTW